MKKSEPELIGGEFYLIDEKKCLYNLPRITGSITGRRGQGCSQDRTLDPQMTTLLGPVLL